MFFCQNWEIFPRISFNVFSQLLIKTVVFQMKIDYFCPLFVQKFRKMLFWNLSGATKFFLGFVNWKTVDFQRKIE